MIRGDFRYCKFTACITNVLNFGIADFILDFVMGIVMEVVKCQKRGLFEQIQFYSPEKIAQRINKYSDVACQEDF